jgi:hypothetical protein
LLSVFRIQFSIVGVDYFLPVVGWERRIVVLNCFMCMLVLVLRIAYGQVVLLQNVLNFVA